jgi:prolipoprotein diacylglyceryltransferase
MENGVLFSLALIVMFSFRFVDEFFKISQEQFEEGMILNMGQILSLPFILAGVVMLILTVGKKRVTISTDKRVVGGEEIRRE